MPIVLSGKEANDQQPPSDVSTALNYGEVLQALHKPQDITLKLLLKALMRIIKLDRETEGLHPDRSDLDKRSQALDFLTTSYIALIKATPRWSAPPLSPAKDDAHSAAARARCENQAVLAVESLYRFVELDIHPGKGGGAQGLYDLSLLLHDHILPLLERMPQGHTVKLLWSVNKARKFERVQFEEKVMEAGCVDPQFYTKSSSILLHGIHGLDSNELSQLVTALGVSKDIGHEILTVICQSSESRLSEFKAGNLVGIMKVMANLKYENPSFYHKVAKTLADNMSRLDGKSVSSLCKSFSELKYDNEDFYNLCSRRLQQTMSTMSAVHVSDVAWSFALRSIHDLQLYSSLAFRVNQLQDDVDFTAPVISKLIWSFGRQKMAHNQLIWRSERIVMGLLEEGEWQFSIRNISNLLHGYANMGYSNMERRNPQLLPKLAERAIFLLQNLRRKKTLFMAGNESSIQSEGGSEVSIAKEVVESYVDDRGRKVTRTTVDGVFVTEAATMKDGTVATRTWTQGLASIKKNADFIPQNLSDIAWSLSDYVGTDEVFDRLFSLIAELAVEDIKLFRKTSLVDIAFAFASAKKYDVPLFDAIVTTCVNNSIADFGPSYISELLWSVSVALDDNKEGFKDSKRFVELAVEAVFNKWERISLNPDWQQKVSVALLSLGAEEICSGHPLIERLHSAIRVDSRVVDKQTATV